MQNTGRSQCEVEKNDFEKAISQCPKFEDLSGPELKIKISKARKILANQEEDWEKRKEQLKTIQGITVMENYGDNTIVLNHLNSLISELKTTLEDLRSNLFVEAAITVSCIIKKFGNNARIIGEQLLPTAMSRIATTKKVISSSSATLAHCIVENIKIRQIFVIFAEFSKSKNKNQRREAMQLCQTLIKCWSEKEKAELIGEIVHRIECALSDAAVEVRAAAKTTFAVFKQYHCERADRLFQSLHSSKQRLLGEDNEKSSRSNTSKRGRSSVKPASKKPSMSDVMKTPAGRKCLRLETATNTPVKTPWNSSSSSRKMRTIVSQKSPISFAQKLTFNESPAGNRKSSKRDEVKSLPTKQSTNIKDGSLDNNDELSTIAELSDRIPIGETECINSGVLTKPTTILAPSVYKPECLSKYSDKKSLLFSKEFQQMMTRRFGDKNDQPNELTSVMYNDILLHSLDVIFHYFDKDSIDWAYRLVHARWRTNFGAKEDVGLMERIPYDGEDGETSGENETNLHETRRNYIFAVVDANNVSGARRIIKHLPSVCSTFVCSQDIEVIDAVLNEQKQSKSKEKLCFGDRDRKEKKVGNLMENARSISIDNNEECKPKIELTQTTRNLVTKKKRSGVAKKQIYQCQNCQITLKPQRNPKGVLRTHVLSHFQAFKCATCQKAFPTKKDTKRHTRSQHGNEEIIKRSKDQDEKILLEHFSNFFPSWGEKVERKNEVEEREEESEGGEEEPEEDEGREEESEGGEEEQEEEEGVVEDKGDMTHEENH